MTATAIKAKPPPRRRRRRRGEKGRLEVKWGRRRMAEMGHRTNGFDGFYALLKKQPLLPHSVQCSVHPPRDLNHKRPTLIPVWTPTSQNQPLWRQNRSPFRHPFRSCMSERSPSSPQKKRGGHRQVRRDRLTCWYLTSSPSPFPSFLCYTTERRGTQ